MGNFFMGEGEGDSWMIDIKQSDFAGILVSGTTVMFQSKLFFSK